MNNPSQELPPDAVEQDTIPGGSACCSFTGVLKAAATITAAGIGATAAVNTYIFARTPRMSCAVPGVFNRYPGRHGDLAYTVTGSGPPLLLLHSLKPGSSMNEWAMSSRILDQQHTVYCMDFLGWGFSDKPRERYHAADLSEQIYRFIEDVIEEPAVVVASGESCGLAVCAAREQPSVVSRLVLVCPTAQEPESLFDTVDPFQERIFSNLIGFPVIGTAIYNCLASRQALRSYAMEHLFFDKTKADEALIDQLHIAAHQPGSQYAGLANTAGLLHVDSRTAWSQLQMPALLVWGRNAVTNGLDAAPEWLALKPDARLEVIDDAMLLPHVEHPEVFSELLLAWMGEPEAAAK